MFFMQEIAHFFYFFLENRCSCGKKVIPLHRFFRVMAN